MSKGVIWRRAGQGGAFRRCGQPKGGEREQPTTPSGGPGRCPVVGRRGGKILKKLGRKPADSVEGLLGYEYNGENGEPSADILRQRKGPKRT